MGLFSRHAEDHAFQASQETALGCAALLAEEYISRWDRPHTSLSDRGAEFISVVFREVFKRFGAAENTRPGTTREQTE